MQSIYHAVHFSIVSHFTVSGGDKQHSKPRGKICPWVDTVMQCEVEFDYSSHWDTQQNMHSYRKIAQGSCTKIYTQHSQGLELKQLNSDFVNLGNTMKYTHTHTHTSPRAHTLGLT